MVEPNSSRFNILDTIAPAEARLRSLFSPHAWTSFKARDVLRKTRHPAIRGFRASIGRLVARATQPQEWQFFLVISFMVFAVVEGSLLLNVWSLPGVDLFQNGTNGYAENFLTSAWQVLASVIGLTFVIIIFLLEFAHTRAFENRAFPLFASETRLVPIVIFEMLTLISIGINVVLLGNPVIRQDSIPSLIELNAILFVLSLFFTMSLYVNTFRFINPRFFRQIFLKYNREQVARSVEDELQRRIAFQLVSQHCEKCGIDFSPWLPDRRPNTVGIKSHLVTSEIFEVIDVNLHLLFVASQRVRAWENGKDGKIVFACYPKSRISLDRPIAYIPMAANRPQVASLIEQSIRVAPLSAVAVIQEDNDLRLNRDLISDSIRAGRAEDVEELLDQYLETLRAFLGALEEHSLRYTSEMVRGEDGLIQDWPVVNMIQKHYFHLSEQALRSSDQEIVHHFVSFPLHVMSLAYRFQDQLLFRKFASSFVDLYTVAKRVMTDAGQRKHVYERCWRLLVEFYEYAIQTKLEEATVTEVQAEVLGDYIEYLIVVLNRLLKSALDFRDLDQFRHFAAAAEQIPSRLGTSPFDRLENLEDQLKLARDEQTHFQLDQEIAQTQTVSKQLKRGKQARQISFIGLGGWLVHLIETTKISPREFNDYSGVLASQFIDMRQFYALYSNIVSQANIGDSYNWDWWELEERTESHGEPTSSAMQYSDWIAKYFLYRSIELSPLELDAILDLHPTSVSKEIAASVDKNIDVMKSSEIWRAVLVDPNPDDFARRTAALREMHNRTAKRQEIIEEDELIRQSIDTDLVIEFASQVHKYWSELATIRNLCKYFGRYIEKPDSALPEGLGQFGLSRIEPKGVFVRQNRIWYANWGEGHGHSMARGEDTALCESFSIFPTIEAPTSDFEAAMQKCLGEFKVTGLKPVILYGGRQLHMLFFDSPHYEPQWRTRNSIPEIVGIQGFFDGALVASLPAMLEDSVIVVDFARFANLVQYSPDSSGQFPLSISVKEITSEIATDLLGKQPELGKDPQTSEMLDREIALRRLQQRVIVEIWQRFRLEGENAEAGYRIHFTESQKSEL